MSFSAISVLSASAILSLWQSSGSRLCYYPRDESTMRHQHTFIVRIVRDDDTQTLHGLISEPSSADDWRASFASASELWKLLLERLQIAIEATHAEQSERKE